MIDTMLATWGLSLFLIGLTTTIFGNTVKGISAPLGGFDIGAYHTSVYGLVIIAIALLARGRRLVRPALHPIRPDRASDDAEPGDGRRAGRVAARAST